MSSLNTQFEHELQKKLKDRMIEIADILCAGQAVKDFADYRRYVGEFLALQQVHDIYCDDVNTILSKR